MQDAERRAKVERAIAWWRSNQRLIESLLPVDVRHADGHGLSHYPENFNVDYWIAKWESGDRGFTLEDAELRLCEQLRPLFPVVREAIQPTSDSINRG